MKGQTRINIKENKPAKFIETKGGYEMISNDDSMRIRLRHISMMNAPMESGFYSTILWIKEDGGWIETDNSQNYSTKEEFIKAISGSEDFTQAVREYEEYIKV